MMTNLSTTIFIPFGCGCDFGYYDSYHVQFCGMLATSNPLFNKPPTFSQLYISCMTPQSYFMLFTLVSDYRAQEKHRQI